MLTALNVDAPWYVLATRHVAVSRANFCMWLSVAEGVLKHRQLGISDPTPNVFGGVRNPVMAPATAGLHHFLPV